MQIQKFVNVVHRRPLAAEEWLLPKIEPLLQIETHMSMEERLQLLQTALRMPPNFLACEVGSFLGASASFLAVAAAHHNGHLHCVDTWDNRNMGVELPRDTFEEFRRNTALYAAHITIHRGEAALVAPRIPTNLNLLFLDGDHSYAAARADLFAYAPKLKPGGLLLLHDFTDPPVQQAAREYLATRPARDLGAIHSLKCYQFI